MCLQDSDFDSQLQVEFLHFCKLLQSVFHYEFHEQLEQLKDQYAPVNPDADTRQSMIANTGDCASFVSLLENLLQKANYIKLGQADLDLALEQHSMFKIHLEVDFSDFEEVLLFCRGQSQREEQVSQFFGLRKKTISFRNYDRVVIYIKFRKDFAPDATLLPDCQPGATLLKLFQNVPRADLEMLFPNTRLRMRTIDRLLIGVPAVVSGAVVITTKLGTTLVLIGSLIGFWLGLSRDEVKLDKATVLALLADIAALGGYLWKQFHNFNNRKIKFLKVLTENLYFKNLDNNAGVFHRLLDDAEEEECKEAILAYYALLRTKHPLSTDELDRWIEQWFASSWQCQLDFDVSDALDKLGRLGLLEARDDSWTVRQPAQASAILDRRWDQYFNDSH
jgi:hypothetical protein